MTKNWSQADRDDYYAKSAWDAALFGKTRMALPIFNGGSMIYYRKDLLAKAGIDPKSLTTWDAILKAAKKLTVDSDNDGRVDVWGFGTPPPSPLKTEASPILYQPAREAGRALHGRLQGAFRDRDSAPRD